MNNNAPVFGLLSSCIIPHIAALDASVVVAIAGAISTVIAAISAALLSWKAASKAEATSRLAEAVSKKADEIKVQVDGNLTKATNALAVANETNAGYQRLIAEMTLTKKDTQELALELAKSTPATTDATKTPDTST